MIELYISSETNPENSSLEVDSSSQDSPDFSPSYPSGPIPLGSPFYIERPHLEEQIYQQIEKPGALVRVKAPREMGKTSMLLRILDYAKRKDYRTVNLDLQQVNEGILSDFNRFLRWLCANVARQLQLEARLDDYWDEDIGSSVSCTLYFQDHILERLETPFVLALDEVNRIFEHPQIARDFFPLLRSWYEEAKRLPVWQKLRLVVAHSTEIYVPLQLKQSPFNVGLPVQLEGFTLDRVQQLARRYKLNWTDGEAAQQLMMMVKGHPALVQIALYHLSRQELTLEQLLKTAPTSTGVYSHHLQRHLAALEDEPELAEAYNAVVSALDPTSLDPIAAYKLNSMGLIQLEEDKAMPSCQLYGQYFQDRLQAKFNKST